MRILLLVGLVALHSVLASSAAQAVIINSGPMAWEADYAAFLGPSAAGGTFTTSEDGLWTFTLWLGVEGGTQSNALRAVVMETDAAGMPTGVPIWESGDFEAIFDRTEFTFNPNISLTLGEQYFIGVDTGLFTAATGGDLTIQASGPQFMGDDAIVGGKYWENPYGGGWGTLAKCPLDLKSEPDEYGTTRKG